jgi:hypothetical protein
MASAQWLPILAIALGACRPAESTEDSLPPCPSLSSVDTTGWIAIRQPELTFRVPPAFSAAQRDTGEYGIHVGLVAPERDLYVEYGSTASTLTYTKRQIVRQPYHPSCGIDLGGRRARVAVWQAAGDLWRSPAPERPKNYGAGAYWPPTGTASDLVLAIRLRDSSHIAEALTILSTVQLHDARR